MAWFEKDHNDHPVPTPCYVQGRQSVDQAAQSHIQPGLECLQGWGIHSLLGQPVQCVTTLWVKNFFLISNLNLPCLCLKPFPLVLSLSAIGPLLFIRSLQVLEGHNEISPKPSLLQAKQSRFPQPFLVGEVLQPSDHLSGPPLDLLQELHILPVLGAPGLDTVLQIGPNTQWQELPLMYSTVVYLVICNIHKDS